jgi:hypothetical protein
MDERDAPLDDSKPDPDRRMLLTGLTAAYLSSLIAPADAQPATNASQDAFLGLSRILTGRPSLDPAQAARLYEALVADSPQFQDDVRTLLVWIDERRIDAGQLQQALDAEQPALAALPRKIVTAWYTGIVGEGERARCITFETSLMYVVVADRLNPPSYCSGPYGSWVDKPA